MEPYKWGRCAIGSQLRIIKPNAVDNTAIKNKKLDDGPFTQGKKLFKDKKYKKAIPLFYDALEHHEKAYSEDPKYFKINIGKIIEIHTQLAGYYRWIRRDPQKAIEQYKQLIAFLDTVKSNRNRYFQIWFLMGEIHEKDLKEYKKAKYCYEKALELVIPENKKGYFNKGLINWLTFLSEKINILYLNENQQFSKRTLRYPSMDYASFFYQYNAFSELSFIEEDFMNYANSYYSIEKLEELSLKYPNSYQLMSLGMVLFHHFIEEKDFKSAMIVADRLLKRYPYDMNMIRLHFEIAEFIYLEQKKYQEHHRWIKQGLKFAESINIDMVLGPDWRFSSPEKTWQSFIASIKKGDIDAIEACFSHDSGLLQRNSFLKSKKQLDEIASDRMQLNQKIHEEENYVEYKFQRIVKGKVKIYDISFSHLFGEWKIKGLGYGFIRFMEGKDQP